MLDLKNTVTIQIDWRNLESIELAEKAKAKLENDGWEQVHSFGGLHLSALVYAENKQPKEYKIERAER